MQTVKNDMKVGKSVSIPLHPFERPCKHQILTDPKSRNTSYMMNAKKFIRLVGMPKVNSNLQTILNLPHVINS